MDFFNDFVPYVGLAVILYFIRQTGTIGNKWIPIVGLALAIPYSFWEQGVSPESLLDGIQYAALGVATIASVKYFLEQQSRRG